MAPLPRPEPIEVNSGPEDDPSVRVLKAALPERFEACLPRKNISILDLLRYGFPKQNPPPLIQPHASAFFSPSAPTEDLDGSLSRPLLPSSVLVQLQQRLPEALRDGMQSVVDPAFKLSRLPLYAVQLWSEMDRAMNLAAEWKGAEVWRQQYSVGEAGLEWGNKVLSMLKSLPWTTEVQVLQIRSPARILSRLLSDDWLDDDVMNMAMDYIAHQARENPATASVVVAPLWLYLRIHKASHLGEYGQKTGPVLRRYSALINDEKKTRLYFPVLDADHWTIFEVNFAKKTLRHGEYSVIN